VSFATITLCIASQRVVIVVYFVIDSVRKLLDTPSYTHTFSIRTLSKTDLKMNQTKLKSKRPDRIHNKLTGINAVSRNCYLRTDGQIYRNKHVYSPISFRHGSKKWSDDKNRVWESQS